MSNIDFTNVNISFPDDVEQVESGFFDYFSDEECKESFSPYKEKLAQLHTIVGFGRGFWAGVSDYFYLMYHKGTKKFYWFLKNNESDSDVYLYEINESDAIFALLSHYSIEANFELYDKTLDYNALYYLSVGKESNLSKEQTERYRYTPLTDIFGEDTEELRIALMNYYPASSGSFYPHKEYEKQILAPLLKEQLQQQVATYNASDFQVFEKNNGLYITFGDDTFKLTKLNR